MIDVVVVGAGYAGLACALRLDARARRAGVPLRVRLVSARTELVERIRLHQRAAGQALPPRPLSRLLGGTGVEHVAGTVQAIDVAGRTLQVDGAALPWDRLVLATGSRTDLQRVPGADAHAIAIEPESAAALGQRLAELPRGARVAVVGGGLTGLEIASEIAEARGHLAVHLVAGTGLLRGFPAAASEHARHVLRGRLGITLHEGARVLAVDERHVETATARLPFDLCLWTAGFAASPLGRDAGLQVNAAGQVRVDATLRSISHPDVHVAGDLATCASPMAQPWPMGCKSALPMGAHVAGNLLRELQGQSPLPFDYALLFYCISLGRRDGVVQWADDQGRLAGRLLTGRRAAWFKEFICRSTVWALALERRGWPGVVWKRGGPAPEAAVTG